MSRKIKSLFSGTGRQGRICVSALNFAAGKRRGGHIGLPLPGISDKQCATAYSVLTRKQTVFCGLKSFLHIFSASDRQGGVEKKTDDDSEFIRIGIVS